MAKKSKPPTAKQPPAKKRGPKEERLVITGDPQEALARLLRPVPRKPKKD